MELLYFGVFLSCFCIVSTSPYPGPKDCLKGPDFVGSYYDTQSGGEEKKMLWGETTVKTVIMKDRATKSKKEPINGKHNFGASCCGCAFKWGIDVGRPDGMNIRGDKIKMQFWRPVDTDKYRLTAEEEYTIPSSASYFYPVSDYTSKTKPCVQVGDLLGYTGNFLEWKTSNGYDEKLAGTVVAADGLNPQLDTDYVLPTEIAEAQDLKMVAFALGAWFEPRKTNPSCGITFVNGGTFKDDTATGTILGSVFLVAPGEPSITKHYLSLEDKNGLKAISIDPDTGKINVTGSLSVKPPKQDFLIRGRVTEDICYRFGECQSTLTITWNNKPINITNKAGAGNLKESTEVATPLYTVETADENRLEFLDQNPTCKILTINPPNGGGFSMAKHKWISTQWVLSYDGAPAMSSLNSPVTIQYQCDDEYGSSDTGTFVLTVDQNAAPTLTNKVDAATGCILVNASAQTIRKNDAVAYLGPVDVEGDTILTKFTKQNTSSPFDWNDKNYEIVATQDLSTLLHPTHDFTILLWDKWTATRKSSYKVCVTITGLNSIPKFSDCPITKPLQENQVNGIAVVKPGVTDANLARDKQILTYSWTVSPAQFQSSFTLNKNTGEITINGNGIANDFEKADKILNGGCIDVILKVTDGIHFAAKDCNVCIKITNKNDPPNFQQATDTVEFYEQSMPGTIPVINTVVIDEDAGDTRTYTILSGNDLGYYKIDSTTGQISLAKDCDVEAGCPLETTLNIEVKDSGGLTSGMTAILKVLDKNDNAPTFVTQSCSITVNESMTGNEIVAVVAATDPDRGANGQFSYRVVGIGWGVEYFSVESNGNVILRKPIAYRDGVQYSIRICAKDSGSPSLEGCVSCVVNFPVIVTTPKHIIRWPPCYFCTGRGVAMFTMFMVGVAVALPIGLYFVNKYLLKGAASRWLKQLLSPRKPCIKPKINPPRFVRPAYRPPPTPEKKSMDVEVQKIIPATQLPAEPAQTTRFNFWNERDTELHNKNPNPSNTNSHF